MTLHLAPQPNGQLTASVSEKQTIKVWNVVKGTWNVVKGTIEFTIRVDSGEVTCVELSPNGSLLVAGPSD